ncbi:MAG: ribosome-associated translation inhibitor RaiA [Endomicrobia bacterium]|nr:ribosome-associated translation inhibitor RaiA [Endomicrobiia bacterium]
MTTKENNNIKLIGRDIEITNEVREYIEKKIKNISRYTSKISSLEIMIKKQRYIYEIQVLLHTYNKKIIKLIEKDKNLWVAIDNVADRLKDVMVKYKEKIITRKKHTGSIVDSYIESISPDEKELYKKNVIFVEKMSEKEAVEKIRNNDKEMIVFFNTDTNKVSIAKKNQYEIEITDIELENITERS